MGEDRTAIIENKIDDLAKVMAEIKDSLVSDINRDRVKINTLETQVGIILKVSGWILTPAIGVIVTSLIWLVMKK